MDEGWSPRQREILRAATAVLAGSGSRGLTHRAVDREAGLAEGSTSAYFRSRDALQAALADYVSTLLTEHVEELARKISARPNNHEYAAAQTAALFGRWLEDRVLLTARLELSVSATRDEDLARGFLAWRGRLVEVVDRLLEARWREQGLSTPPDGLSAESLVAALDGVLLAALLLPRSSGRRFARASVDQLLGTLNAEH